MQKSGKTSPQRLHFLLIALFLFLRVGSIVFLPDPVAVGGRCLYLKMMASRVFCRMIDCIARQHTPIFFVIAALPAGFIIVHLLPNLSVYQHFQVRKAHLPEPQIPPPVAKSG